MKPDPTQEYAEDSIHEIVSYVIDQMGNTMVQPIVRQAIVAFTLAIHSQLVKEILQHKESSSSLLEEELSDVFFEAFENYQALGEKYMQRIRTYGGMK